DEVAHVLVRCRRHARQTHGVSWQSLVEQCPLAGLNAAAAHPDPLVVLAFEQNAVVGHPLPAAGRFADRPVGGWPTTVDKPGAGSIARTVGVGVGNFKGWMAVEAIGAIRRRRAGARNTDGPTLVHSQRPLRDVVVMCTPVGHLAAGVFIPPAEVVM